MILQSVLEHRRRGLGPCCHHVRSILTALAETGVLEVIFAGLWQCSFPSFLYQGADSTAVCPPTAHISSTGSTGLSPGISSTVLTLCWETKQTFWQQHIRMCHPVPSCAITGGEGSGKWKTSQKSVRKDAEREKLCGQHLQNYSIVVVNYLSFLHQVIKILTS